MSLPTWAPAPAACRLATRVRRTSARLMAGQAASRRHPDRSFLEKASRNAKECDMKSPKLHLVLAALLAKIEALSIG